MRRLGLAAALLLLASATLANPGDTRVSVTLKPDVLDAHAAGEELVATYGGRLVETTAQTVVLEISVARSGLLARDPRVASVTVLGSQTPAAPAAPTMHPLKPRATADDPCTTAPTGLPHCTGPYQYDGAGNIKAVGGDVFVYDELSRLKKATLASAGGVAESYDYDAFGNLKNITVTPSAPRPMLPTDPRTNHLQNEGTDAEYDEAGNLVRWAGHEYTYDAGNMLAEMNAGIVDLMYVYTAAEERIATLTVSASGYTAKWRIRGLDNKVLREFQEENYAASTQPWAWSRDYVYRDGLLLSSYTVTGTGTAKRLDYHLDHLGTPRLITNETGQQESVHHYFPFGREITPSGGEAMKFTGHERDFTPYDYQDYMHARYGNPYLGRFLSVDPLRGSASSPQSLNRYAYVLNNPVLYVDPRGLICTSVTMGPFGTKTICDPGWTEFFNRGYLAQLRNLALMQAAFANGLITQYKLLTNRSTLGQQIMRGLSQPCAPGIKCGIIQIGELTAGPAAELTLLNKSLASEAQLADAEAGIGRVIAGAGASIVKDAPRLEAQYGPGIWVKMSTWGYRAADGHLIETHFYKNVLTGQVVEFKSTLPWH
jgi:RHS repeat-associated protein